MNILIFGASGGIGRWAVKHAQSAAKMSFAASREDIAAFMVDQVENRSCIRSMPIIGS